MQTLQGKTATYNNVTYLNRKPSVKIMQRWIIS